jgi:hypothetical protein
LIVSKQTNSAQTEFVFLCFFGAIYYGVWKVFAFLAEQVSLQRDEKIIGASVGQTEKSLSLRPIFKHLITINYVCKNSLDTTG